MTERSWTIRPYQAGDEVQAAALFERCFGRSMSEAQYLWKMQVGIGRPTNCMLAVAGERVVGQYAGWRVEALIEGQRRKVMVAIDAMVEPDFRRQGILTALIREAHRQWQAEGAAFLLAMPNEQYGSLIDRVGWHNSFPLKWQIRPLRLEKIGLRRLGLKTPVPALLSGVWNWYWRRQLRPDSEVEIEAVSQVGTAFDGLWEGLKNKRPLSIVRDAAWINWRYLSVPDRPYRVLLARRAGQAVGYVVYWLQSFAGGAAGMVAEFLYEDGGVRDGLLAAVLEQLAAAGAESLIGLAVPGTAESEDLKGVGAVFSWGAFDVWILPLDGAVDFSMLREPASWLMHGGDFDII